MRGATHLVLATALLAFGGPALADDERGVGETAEQAMDRTDRNDDGYVDRGEYHSRMVDVFYLADDDKNGHLVAGEYVDTQMGDFEAADANDDGKLEMHEFIKETSEVYEAVDTNSDGRLSEREVIVTYED